MVLLAAFLGWMFDGYEIGLFPLIARPALRHLLSDPGDAQIGQWMGIITACFLIGAALGGLVFVIRFKNKRGKAMDEAVDSLLKEMGVAVPAAEPESKPTEE